jgi:hypothetical protein
MHHCMRLVGFYRENMLISDNVMGVDHQFLNPQKNFISIRSLMSTNINGLHCYSFLCITATLRWSCTRDMLINDNVLELIISLN